MMMFDTFIPPYILLPISLYVVKRTWEKKKIYDKRYGIDVFGARSSILLFNIVFAIYCMAWFVEDYCFDFGFNVSQHAEEIIKIGVSNLVLWGLFAAILPVETYKEIMLEKGFTIKKVQYFIGNIGFWLMVYLFFEQWFLSRYGTHLIPTLLKRISLI